MPPSLLSLCFGAWELQLLKHAHPKTCALQAENFCSAAKRKPCLPQLEKSLHSNEPGTTPPPPKKKTKLGRQTFSLVLAALEAGYWVHESLGDIGDGL